MIKLQNLSKDYVVKLKEKGLKGMAKSPHSYRKENSPCRSKCKLFYWRGRAGGVYWP